MSEHDETRKNDGQPEIKDMPEKPTTEEQEEQVKGGRMKLQNPVDAASRAPAADKLA